MSGGPGESASPDVQNLLADRQTALLNKTTPGASAAVQADADTQLTEVAVELSELGYA